MKSFRFELIFAACSLFFGLIVLPGLIYWIGGLLLGPYAGGPHVGSFYGDFYRSLGAGSELTWFLGVGPYLALLILRFVFASVDGPSDEAADDPPHSQRREPHVTG